MCIDQATVGHVNEELEVGEEVNTEYGFLDICNNKYPSKCAPYSQVNGEGAGTTDHN